MREDLRCARARAGAAVAVYSLGALKRGEEAEGMGVAGSRVILAAPLCPAFWAPINALSCSIGALLRGQLIVHFFDILAEG